MEESAEIYCKKLGHQLPVSYCLAPGRKLFCSSFRDCWYSRIDVDRFLKDRFSSEEIKAAMAPSAPKVSSILSILEKHGAIPKDSD